MRSHHLAPALASLALAASADDFVGRDQVANDTCGDEVQVANDTCGDESGRQRHVRRRGQVANDTCGDEVKGPTED